MPNPPPKGGRKPAPPPAPPRRKGELSREDLAALLIMRENQDLQLPDYDFPPGEVRKKVFNSLKDRGLIFWCVDSYHVSPKAVRLAAEICGAEEE